MGVPIKKEKSFFSFPGNCCLLLIHAPDRSASFQQALTISPRQKKRYVCRVRRSRQESNLLEIRNSRGRQTQQHESKLLSTCLSFQVGYGAKHLPRPKIAIIISKDVSEKAAAAYIWIFFSNEGFSRSSNEPLAPREKKRRLIVKRGRGRWPMASVGWVGQIPNSDRGRE